MLTVTVSSPAHYATLLSAFAAACGTGGAYCAEVLEVLAAEGPISLWASATALARRANDAADERASQNFTIDEGEIRYSTREHEITLSCSEGSTDWVLVIDHERNDDSDRMQVAVAVLEAAGLADHVEAWRLSPVRIVIGGLTERQLVAGLSAYVGTVTDLDSASDVAAREAVYHHHEGADLLAFGLALSAARCRGLQIRHGVETLAIEVPAQYMHQPMLIASTSDDTLTLVVQPGEWDAAQITLSALHGLGVPRERLVAAAAAATDEERKPRPLTGAQVAELLGAVDA